MRTAAALARSAVSKRRGSERRVLGLADGKGGGGFWDSEKVDEPPGCGSNS